MVRADRIEIRQKIFFAFGLATILPRSDFVLGEVREATCQLMTRSFGFSSQCWFSAAGSSTFTASVVIAGSSARPAARRCG